MAQQQPEGTAPTSRAVSVEDEQAWLGGGQRSERKAKFLREQLEQPRVLRQLDAAVGV